ncbi:MAG TPA: hypothetical protein VK789_13845 [Bryobacteraceae bacterium]|jgi:hypothetical protein|nr:hypothetical protein [Bryobacteraceae bacterium]
MRFEISISNVGYERMCVAEDNPQIEGYDTDAIFAAGTYAVSTSPNFHALRGILQGDSLLWPISYMNGRCMIWVPFGNWSNWHVPVVLPRDRSLSDAVHGEALA